MRDYNRKMENHRRFESFVMKACYEKSRKDLGWGWIHHKCPYCKERFDIVYYWVGLKDYACEDCYEKIMSQK